jgi:hypothetical protein
MELLKTWHKYGFSLRLYWEGDPRNLSYVFRDRGKVIFRGDRYGVGAGTCIDSLEAVYGCLVFLAVRKGDTDPDFFKDYTPDQLAWTESGRAEELSLLVCDFEERQAKRNRK